MNMSNYDNGFARAQRAYDNQMPPEDDNVDCPDCDGSGKVDLSNCCGADVDSDILICSKCHEHCDLSDCDTCEGTGQVSAKNERAKAYEEYLENKADQARDDRLMEESQSGAGKVGSNTAAFLDKHSTSEFKDNE